MPVNAQLAGGGYAITISRDGSYLESPHIWGYFHASLANEIRDQLTPRLRPRYVAALTPRVTYEAVTILATPRTVKPDVGIYQTPASPLSAAAVMMAPAPLVRTVTVEEPFHEYALEIRDSATGSLVTAIEILSPINKRLGRKRSWPMDASGGKCCAPRRNSERLICCVGGGGHRH